MRRLGVLLGTVVVAALLAGCGAGGGSGGNFEYTGGAGEIGEAVGGDEADGGTGDDTVSRGEFGGRWPLTVSSGTLRCESFGPELGEVIFAAPDGTEYGVNGLAQQGGHPQIDPIWRYEPGMKRYGLKVNIGPLLDRGLALCE